ncbi:glycosyltransferase family protein [Leeuwenhoekiella marinoflava]|uniref:glycosyl transferase family 1 n=1 Tax=Leeuwenhoekiella marinoflava TaxID=988 RepID=UPI00093297DC|nr:glycosyl transferase family 1 [Leeuwenhoekiella marinoflava]
MKKVLIICYYWPPAGGPGVQRWLKFVKYLRDFDIEPVVYVPENPHYPIEDSSLEKEIPNGIEIIKTPIFEPYGFAKLFSKESTRQISSGIIKPEGKQSFLQKLMLFVRGNLFIPDARKWWVKPSIKFLASYLDKNPVDIIITTGPPHSLHLIGLALKVQKDLSWLADFRDPWTTIGYQKKLKLTDWATKKNANLEFEVLNKADHILVTSPTTQSDFEKTTSTPISCITNGFDDEIVPETSLDTAFTLAHIGSLLEDRNPEILWEVLQELVTELPHFSKDLKIELTGRVGASVVDSIKEKGLETNLSLPGYVNHTEALQKQHSAQLLLLIEIDSQETEAIIPGKLFEYLASRRPILAIGPKHSDIASILKKSESGIYFNYQQKQGLKKHIKFNYELFKNTGISSTSGNVDAYSRKNLTRDLARLIHSI